MRPSVPHRSKVNPAFILRTKSAMVKANLPSHQPTPSPHQQCKPTTAPPAPGFQLPLLVPLHVHPLNLPRPPYIHPSPQRRIRRPQPVPEPQILEQHRVPSRLWRIRPRCSHRAKILCHRPPRPVQIHPPQIRLLRRRYCRRHRRLVDHIGVVIRHHLVANGPHLSSLVIVLGLQNHVPPKRIEHVRFRGRPNQRLARESSCPHQRQRMPSLRIAQSPPQHHKYQRRNRPRPSPERLLPRSNLAIRQRQNPGDQQR